MMGFDWFRSELFTIRWIVYTFSYGHNQPHNIIPHSKFVWVSNKKKIVLHKLTLIISSNNQSHWPTPHVSGFCNLDHALTIESYESHAHTPYMEKRGREFL